MIVQSLSQFTQGKWSETELIYFITELKAIKDEFIHYLDHSSVSVLLETKKQAYCFSDTASTHHLSKSTCYECPR